MEMNEKTIGEIAGQLGLSGGKNAQKQALEYLSSKSDAELERELLKIKEQLRANNIGYDKQMAVVKSIAPMLDASQRAKLQRVMDLLNK